MRKPSLEETWMRRAIELARDGTGRVSPNPLVGCLIVRDGEILGEGAHLQFGAQHAEVNAIKDAESRANSVAGSTLVVNLEPCSHHGQTPPCADLLIEKKISKCVIGIRDPNPQVAGKGIERLRAAGIEVSTGILEDDAAELNRFFLKHTVTGSPYVTIKLAQSLDGRSALSNGESRWITSEQSRDEVHRMRSEYDAVLIGSGTALADNPSLTVRRVSGMQPWRIVLDSQLKLPLELNLFTDEFASKTMVVATREAVERHPEKVSKFGGNGVKIIGIESSQDHVELPTALRTLGAGGIGSVLSEAGPQLSAQFVQAGLFDEIVAFIAPTLLGGDAVPSVGSLYHKALSGVRALRLHEARQVDGTSDIRLTYRIP